MNHQVWLSRDCTGIWWMAQTPSCMVVPCAAAFACSSVHTVPGPFLISGVIWVQHGARYPLVNIQKTIESGHRNSWFTHKKWWFSIVMLVYQRVSPFIIYAPGPATPPSPPIWDGSHILVPYEIFPLPPLWCGGGVALSPSPPCGVVGVWYGMVGMYGVYGRSGMACLESMVCLVCMVGMVCMAWVVGIVCMLLYVCYCMYGRCGNYISYVWYVWYVW